VGERAIAMGRVEQAIAMTPRTGWAAAYRGRRVLVTGHTGFKGGWLSLWLSDVFAATTKKWIMRGGSDFPLLLHRADVCVLWPASNNPPTR